MPKQEFDCKKVLMQYDKTNPKNMVEMFRRD